MVALPPLISEVSGAFFGKAYASRLILLIAVAVVLRTFSEYRFRIVLVVPAELYLALVILL